MYARLTLIGILLSGMMTPFSALAAMLPTCNDMMTAQLGREERLYRSVIFGAAAAKDMTVNGTVVDNDGNAYMKTNDNTWETTDPMTAGTTWTDADMEKKRDVPARRGILEIRTALSSELIPSVLQAVRASQCRMQAVCLATTKARGAPADATTVNVQPDGCIAFDMPVVDSCRTVNPETFDSTGCMTQVDTIISRESRILELIFAYDASYRTLMQFAGTFEGFLGDFRFPLLQPLWQMVRTLGQFDNLPCFQAECNE